MTALQRIKEIEKKYKYHSLCPDPIVWEEISTLLNAFNVMREIAVKHNTVMSRIDGRDVLIDKEFEDRMQSCVLFESK